MFLILLLAWLFKITSPQLKPDVGQAEFVYSLSEWTRNAAIGPTIAAKAPSKSPGPRTSNGSNSTFNAKLRIDLCSGA